MNTYRLISLFFMAAFIGVGLFFLFFPVRLVIFFNGLSGYLGLPLATVQGAGLYSVLAVGYMYLVGMLAFFMFRYPENRYFPLLLANGKFASCFLSLAFAVALKPYLIFLVNAVVDGLIGMIALLLYRRLKRKSS